MGGGDKVPHDIGDPAQGDSALCELGGIYALHKSFFAGVVVQAEQHAGAVLPGGLVKAQIEGGQPDLSEEELHGFSFQSRCVDLGDRVVRWCKKLELGGQELLALGSRTGGARPERTRRKSSV